ncbi:MAG: hypothetical protein PHW60_07355 [Kiritimatiellae bacterium]|nr:hypothetical protein [Kiritimatiellia bacterium]
MAELRAAHRRLVRRMARMERALISLRDAEMLFKALALALIRPPKAATKILDSRLDRE